MSGTWQTGLSPWASRVGFRGRLLLLICVALLPPALYQAYLIQDNVRAQLARLDERARNLVQTGAERFGDIIADARSDLEILTRVPEVREAVGQCEPLLKKVQALRPWARDLWVVHASGSVACTTRAEAQGIDVSDRAWLREALATGAFAVSDLIIGRVVPKPTAVAALATADRSAVVAITLDFDFLQRLAAAVASEDGSRIKLIDGQGVLLAQYPPSSDLVGQGLATRPLIREALSRDAGGYEGEGLDGRDRVEHFIRLPGSDLRLIAGFDRESAQAPARRAAAESVLIFSLVGLGTVLLLGVAGQRIFVAPLRRAEELLRITLDSMDQGLMMVGPDSRLQISNRRARQLLDLPEAFTSAKPLARDIIALQTQRGEFDLLPDDVCQQLMPKFDGSQATSYERARPDGVVLEIRTVPMADGGIVRTFSDVTERRRYEDGLREAKREAEDARRVAEQSAEVKGHFLAAMSHEIRTPINAVTGFAELLRHEDLTTTQAAYVGLIEQAGSALLGVVDDVLDFSRLEAGGVRLERSATSVTTLVDAALALVRPMADKKGLMLTSWLDPRLPPVISADPARLQQILLNLLNNAIKFTQDGFVALRVTAGEEERRLRFTVSDSGIGIATADHARIFQRFLQVRRAADRSHGGSGLGLAICRQLVELMGGELGLVSQPGQGAAFWFEIPLAVAATAALPSIENERDPVISPWRLLVVDDVQTNRELLSIMLRKDGHAVDVAADGPSALAAVAGSSYDAVFLDLHMPRMDGFEVARRIRALPQGRGLPLIAVSADISIEDGDAVRAAGINAFVRKPYRFVQIRAALATSMKAIDDGKVDGLVSDGASESMAHGPLRSLFLDDLARILARIEVETGPTLAETLHALCGTSDLFGHTDLARLARNFEQSVRGGIESETARQALLSAGRALLPQHEMA